MMHTLFNIILGIVPTFVLGGSIAAGIDDDREHRRMFLFIYSLWAITLGMWNWMRSAPVAWTALWLAAGVIALAFSFRRKRG
jgi:hypothetical protein